MPHTFWNTGHQAWIVLLSITCFARRDELWGRFLGVPPGSGGLSIRLPHLYAPATALENRQHRLRLAAMRGRLAACGRVVLGLLRCKKSQPCMLRCGPGWLNNAIGGLPTNPPHKIRTKASTWPFT